MAPAKEQKLLVHSKPLGCVLLLVLLSFLSLTFYSHPNADDFCKAAEVRQFGLVGSMIHVYFSWSGRYVAEGLLRLFPLSVELIKDYWVGPISIYILLGGAFWAFVKSVFGQRLGRLETGYVALIFFALYLSGAPNVYEVLYWNAASFTYQLGNASLLVLIAIAIRAEGYSPKGLILASIACAFLAMITTGTNEIGIFILLLVAAIGSITSCRLNSPARSVWVTTVVVTVVTGAFSILAPGNQVRAMTLPHRGKLLSSMYHASTLGFETLLQWSSSLALWAASLLLIPVIQVILSEAIKSERPPMGILIFPLLWAGAILGVFFTGFYTTGAAPQPRVVNVAYLIFLIGWMFSWAIVMFYLQGNLSSVQVLPRSILGMAKLALIIALLTSANFRSAHADLSRMGKLQEFFRIRYALIDEARSRAENDLIVPGARYAFHSLWEDELKDDPSYWANRCWASYFNLKSISLGNAVSPRL